MHRYFIKNKKNNEINDLLNRIQHIIILRVILLKKEELHYRAKRFGGSPADKNITNHFNRSYGR